MERAAQRRKEAREDRTQRARGMDRSGNSRACAQGVQGRRGEARKAIEGHGRHSGAKASRWRQVPPPPCAAPRHSRASLRAKCGRSGDGMQPGWRWGWAMKRRSRGRARGRARRRRIGRGPQGHVPQGALLRHGRLSAAVLWAARAEKTRQLVSSALLCMHSFQSREAPN